ncbi:MAG: fibronectin type III domain-containing protein [Acutalibacteraceae bacterium]|nr:fibronectin type III domain-containing protein [Acutalibacteraceae bacterium]
MKKIKRITSVFLAVIMCMALASCNYAQTVKITSDGKATLTAKITISEKEIKTLQSADLSEADADSLLLDKSSFDEFIKESDKNGLTKTIDGVKYYSNTTTQKFSDLDELNASLNCAGKITKTDIWFYTNGALGESEDIRKMYKDAGIEITAEMIYTLPYKITETNLEKVDDYTVKYDEFAKIAYVITEKSTAAWTKAANKESAVKDLAKQFYKPKKVSGVKVEYKTTSSVKISWNPLESMFITGYKIEKKVGKNGKWIEIKTMKSDNLKNYDSNLRLFYTDKNFSSNKEYSYRVRGYYKDSSFTVFGAYSTTKTIKTADFKSKVVLSAKAGKGTVTLKIKKSTKNLTGYQIKYSTNKNFSKAKTVTTKKFPVTVKKLKSGQKYYFKIRKYRKGESKNIYSDFSKTVSITVK